MSITIFFQGTCRSSKFAFTNAKRFCKALPRRLTRSAQVDTASSPDSKTHWALRQFRTRPSKPGLAKRHWNLYRNWWNSTYISQD